MASVGILHKIALKSQITETKSNHSLNLPLQSLILHIIINLEGLGGLNKDFALQVTDF